MRFVRPWGTGGKVTVFDFAGTPAVAIPRRASKQKPPAAADWRPLIYVRDARVARHNCTLL